MRAMIFAAGLGSRLRPFTDNCPKALVDLNGKPLLAHVIERLLAAGCTELIVNIHHFAEQIERYFDEHPLDIPVHLSDERAQLMDTGGGLLQARAWLEGSEPFLVHNVDVVSNLDLRQFFEAHQQTGALATLAVRHRQTSRYFMVDENLELCGWENQATGEKKWSKPLSDACDRVAFSGIQVIDPQLFSLVKREGPFSIIEAYLSLARRETIKVYPHDDTFWFDVGKPAELEAAKGLV